MAKLTLEEAKQLRQLVEKVVDELDLAIQDKFGTPDEQKVSGMIAELTTLPERFDLTPAHLSLIMFKSVRDFAARSEQMLEAFENQKPS